MATGVPFFIHSSIESGNIPFSSYPEATEVIGTIYENPELLSSQPSAPKLLLQLSVELVAD
jgi:hypothetical protein